MSQKPGRCVNHSRREATENLLGVHLCHDCARSALRAALALEDEPGVEPEAPKRAQLSLAPGPDQAGDPWTPDVTGGGGES